MRLGRVPYLVIWLALTAGQFWALVQVQTLGPKVPAIIVALQVLKALNAAGRIKDLGRPTDDAFLALLPLASIGLFMQLNQPSPTPAGRASMLASWQSEPTALGLFIDGASTLVRFPAVMFGLALPVGVGAALVDIYVVDTWVAIPAHMEDGGTLLFQCLVGVLVFLGLYTAIQFGKRKTASRASWWPSLLMPPVALFATCAYLGGAIDVNFLDELALAQAGSSQTKLLPYIAGTQSLWVAYALVCGGLLATAWAVVAERSVNPDQEDGVLAVVARRYADVGAVNGGAFLAIWVGLNLVVVPGVVYALQYAFAPVVALVRPDVAALPTSTEDSRPIRRRLFKVLFLGFLADILASLVVLILVVVIADLPAASTIGMGFFWIVKQLPAGLTGIPAWGIMIISVIATWAWGAARIGIAKAWLVRNEAVRA